MRVGIFIGELQSEKSGGGATFQNSILEELKKSQSNHEFYIFYKGSEKIISSQKNIKFIEIDRKSLTSRIRKSHHKKTFLNSQVLENNIEIMWFVTPGYFHVECPFIMTVWDLDHRIQPYFPELSLSGATFEDREKLYKNTIPKASYIIAGNNYGASQVNRFYNFPLERIKTIPLPTPHLEDNRDDQNDFLQKNNLSAGKYLFYPAQFWPHKNHIRLIKALDILKKEGLDLKIAFTGSDKGNKSYIQSKTSEYGLGNDIKFLGFVSKSELITLYKNAACMTFASLCGPDNLPPLEAMSLNCPVICTNGEGMKEQLGGSALFFDGLDENDLVQKIKLLLQDEALKNDLIRQGKLLSQKNSPKNYIKDFLDLLDGFAPIRECWSGEKKFIHL